MRDLILSFVNKSDLNLLTAFDNTDYVFCWWSGGGKIFSLSAEDQDDFYFDDNYYVIIRILCQDDIISDEGFSWEKSKAAKSLIETMNSDVYHGVSCYTSNDGMRILDAIQFFNFLTNNNYCLHTWAGGNNF